MLTRSPAIDLFGDFPLDDIVGFLFENVTANLVVKDLCDSLHEIFACVIIPVRLMLGLQSADVIREWL